MIFIIHEPSRVRFGVDVQSLRGLSFLARKMCATFSCVYGTIYTIIKILRPINYLP
uniref:Uncharacterized protein n=1 Tax=Candidatus Nitrotoga fabula TaxID=2182327 RepID=A0A2X0SFT7_9PROT|nr:protein of unknown function [Candidatus Nitrotoga fabula]